MGSSTEDKPAPRSSRRVFIKWGIAVVSGATLIGVFAPGILKLLSNPVSKTTETTTSESASRLVKSTTPARTTSRTSSSKEATSQNKSPEEFANRVARILHAHGVTKRGFVDYGGFDVTSVAFPSLQSGVQTYAKYGFLLFPFIDVSEGPNNIAQNMSQALPYLKQFGGGVLGPTYFWGYETQFYGNLAQNNPNDQEFRYDLATRSFKPALAFGSYPGVVIDSSALLPYFQEVYSEIAAGLPGSYDDLVGISGDPLADHPINYGNSGGVNMNSYVRFANSLFYSAQVTNELHSDGSLCALWPLVGKRPDYISSGLSVTEGNPIVPPLSMYDDIQAHHSGGQLSSPPTGYGGYLGKSNETLEAGILAFLASKAKITPFDRTDVPLQYWQMDSSFNSAPKIVLTNLNDYGLFMASGGDVGTPWFNFANPGDNESNNPQVYGGYGVATAATVLNYFLSVYPAFMHLQLGDIDTDPNWLMSQAVSTPWAKYSDTINKMGDYGGGFFGYENGQKVLLLMSRFNPNTHCIPGLVGHTFGWNSNAPLSNYFQQYGEYVESLADFKVIVGWPSDFGDQSSVTNWVSNGGTLILLANFHQPGDETFPSELAGVSVAAGGGMLGTVQMPDHPLLSPYVASDINLAYSSATTISPSTRTILDPSNVTTIIGDPKYGPSMWIHNVGSGKVVVLPLTYYGDGLDLNGQGEADCFASGLTFLILNAIEHGQGLETGGVYMQQGGSPKFRWRTSWANPLNANQEGSFSNFMMTVCGQQGGKKIVLFSNMQASPVNPGIGLSKSFFNFGTSGNAVDLNTGVTLPIGSSDFLTDFSVPAEDWTVFSL